MRERRLDRQIGGALLLATILLACQGNGDAASSADARSRPRGDAAPTSSFSSSTAGLGEGFVVWESNRSGRWRIWRRRLDGSGLAQLTPNEAGRQHYCPHIAPDGRRLAYLSSSDSGRAYPEGGAVGSLHLLDLVSGEDHVIVDEARTYFENRAVVWRSPAELVFIGPDRTPRLLDLDTGRSRVLASRVPGALGWLIDATLRYATSNSASFSIYDRERERILPRADLGGCQPYFTHDGRWGVWMAGAGGPIDKMDLATRRIERLLDKDDARLPDGLRYLYFPMPSVDSRLLAFSASRGEHDHFRGDYEVFVVETDPETLLPLGDPVRLTDDPATDRYPDVFLEPLALGRYRGEAPFDIELAVPEETAGEGTWNWSFDDGQTAEGPRVEHRFPRAGSYRVIARRGDTELAAQVRVAPAAPPRPLAARIVGDGSVVEVEFDEPIETPAGVTVRFDSNRSVAGWRIGPDGRRLEIELAAPFEGIDRLRLAGLTDRARPANRMDAAELDVGPPRWPVERDGLEFAWESGDSANLVPSGDGGAERAVSLTARGRARLDHDWAMVLDGGTFQADEEMANRVAGALRDSNEMSLELTVTPGSPDGAVDLVASAGDRNRNLVLRLVKDRLRLVLRTGNRGPEAYPEVDLARLADGRPSHVVVTYSPARLVAYVDGERRVELGPEEIRGDFFHWRELPLAFGSTESGAGRADARLEGVAIYSRVLSQAAVANEAGRYLANLAERRPVSTSVVRARLVARTEPPTLDQISPYREALVVHEYEVVETISGEPREGRLRVAQWSFLDGVEQAANELRAGRIYRLAIEPFAANPQLQSLYVAQPEGVEKSATLFYDPDPGSMPGDG